MSRILMRAALALGAGALIGAAIWHAPEARAQAAVPPVLLLVSTSNSGRVGVATVTVKNNASEPLWEADIRCTYDPSWTLLGAWTGNTPGTNSPSVTVQPVPGPAGVALRPVLGWINLNVPAGGAAGPFTYVFDTNGKAGLTWCSGTFFGNTFTSQTVSDAVPYAPTSAQ
jgi:hypothetical protein